MSTAGHIQYDDGHDHVREGSSNLIGDPGWVVTPNADPELFHFPRRLREENTNELVAHRAGEGGNSLVISLTRSTPAREQFGGSSCSTSKIHTATNSRPGPKQPALPLTTSLGKTSSGAAGARQNGRGPAGAREQIGGSSSSSLTTSLGKTSSGGGIAIKKIKIKGRKHQLLRILREIHFMSVLTRDPEKGGSRVGQTDAADGIAAYFSSSPHLGIPDSLYVAMMQLGNTTTWKKAGLLLLHNLLRKGFLSMSLRSCSRFLALCGSNGIGYRDFKMEQLLIKYRDQEPETEFLTGGSIFGVVDGFRNEQKTEESSKKRKQIDLLELDDKEAEDPPLVSVSEDRDIEVLTTRERGGNPPVRHTVLARWETSAPL